MTEADLAARVIERLLVDPAFRARFRRDPEGACRDAGLDRLAEGMGFGGGKAMHTLDMRESKSSLAGVMMAAAMEGVVIGRFTEDVLPHFEALPGEVRNVLSRVDLPALPKLGGGGAAPAVSGSTPAPALDPSGCPADAGGGGAAPWPPAPAAAAAAARAADPSVLPAGAKADAATAPAGAAAA